MAKDPVTQYLEQHGITSMLDGIVNELVASRPADPISFMINGLLREASARSEEPVMLTRLQELKQTLLADQREALAVQGEKDKLQAEVEKLQYRITHLCRTLDELEKGGAKTGSQAAPAKAAATAPAAAAPAAAAAAVPPGHTPYSWTAGIDAGVPPGHTPYSWTGGGAAPAPAAARAAGGAGGLAPESFSKRVSVGKVLRTGASGAGAVVSVSGWARTIRPQKDMVFVALNDGSSQANLQLVLTKGSAGLEEVTGPKGGTGCSIMAVGELVESQGKGQTIELSVRSITVVGGSDGAVYPLAKKAHTLEHLREVSHLSERTPEPKP